MGHAMTPLQHLGVALLVVPVLITRAMSYPERPLPVEWRAAGWSIIAVWLAAVVALLTGRLG